MNDHAGNITTARSVSPTLELGLWLRALQSFFDLGNHPLGEEERAEVSTRSFKCETRVVRDILLRCLQLTGSHAPGEGLSRTGDAQPTDDLAEVSDSADGSTYDRGASVGASSSLSEMLRDAYKIGGALLEAPTVGYDGWSGLGGILSRELERSGEARLLTAVTPEEMATASHERLARAAAGLTPEELGADVQAIFSAFAGLLERLRFVELSLKRGGHLKRLLAVFTLVHEETRELLDFVEGRALRTEGVEKNVRDTLDGTAYAIRMELRKAFEHELAGVCAMREPPQVYAKLESSHGLLRDCFQQSVVSLAQCLDPTLTGGELFDSFQTKLEQSLLLRGDLWGLVRLAREASGDAEAYTASALLARLGAFMEGSIRFLMFKDWEPFERLVEEIEAEQNTAELPQAIHRFEAFIETLFGQVNMRAVLAGHPFTPDAEAESVNTQP